MACEAHRNSCTIFNNCRNCGNIENSYNRYEYCNISTSDRNLQVLEWLSPLAYRERHEFFRDARVDEVGDWLLRNEIFSAWRTSDGAVKPVLFCQGDPGVGKTFISSLVIDTLRSEIYGSDVAVIYVYCDFSDQNVQSARTVLGSMLRQIVATSEKIPDELQKAFDHAKQRADGCRLPPLEILKMLTKYLLYLKRVFICIDALDEFPTKHQSQLWESLQYIVQQCPNTRLFLTGRPQVRAEVESYFHVNADIFITKPTSGDIEAYVKKRLKECRNPSQMNEELRADILKAIPKWASGIFLLVSLRMDAILEEPTIHKRRQALHGMTRHPNLQHVYQTTFDRMGRRGTGNLELGMRALMWISHSERPLKLQELCYALGLELGVEGIITDNVPSIQTVRNCTLGLVAIDEKASTVRLLHLTLQEYLREHPTFLTAHSMIAEICLAYLQFGSVRDLPSNLDKIPATEPFLEYATCFWGNHAAAEVTELVKRLALQLLDGYENHVSGAVLWRNRIRYWPWDGVVDGISGLHCIAFWGVAEIAIAMLDNGRWKVNGRDSRGNTPLMWAVKHGNDSIVEILLKQEGIEPDAVVQDDRTVFSFAAELGNEGAVKLLLECGDVDLNPSDSGGLTPLSYAARDGRDDLVQLLLQYEGVEPNLLDANGRPPLSYAAMNGRDGAAGLLLEGGAVYPNSSDNDGLTPLSYAARDGREDLVQLLLQRGDVNPNSLDDSGRPPLSYAAMYGREEVVELLLKRTDINPNSPGTNGLSPLSFAAMNGQDGVVKLLLERGDVDPNLRDNRGQAPLSLAASRGHKGVVKLLLECGGIDPKSPDNDGLTPLLCAVMNGREDVARLLLERRDVDPNSLGNNGLSALSYAAKCGREELVKMFLEREDLKPDSRDNRGRTPLSFAASRGHEGIVKLFLGRGDVNPDSSDRDGRTPLSYATRSRREGVVKLLSNPRDHPPPAPIPAICSCLAFLFFILIFIPLTLL